jgi:hypothetical protein
VTELLLSLAIIAVLAVMAIGSRSPADSKASPAPSTVRLGSAAVEQGPASHSSEGGEGSKPQAARIAASDSIAAKWIATLSSRAS